MIKKSKDIFESIADLVEKVLKEILEVRNERMDRLVFIVAEAIVE